MSKHPFETNKFDLDCNKECIKYTEANVSDGACKTEYLALCANGSVAVEKLKPYGRYENPELKHTLTNFPRAGVCIAHDPYKLDYKGRLAQFNHVFCFV